MFSNLLLSLDEHGLPLDLAVIPSVLTEPLADALAATPAGLHQHGYAHANHQVEGRKSEFGPARGRAAQRADIEAGQERLRALLGDRLDPFFTPPWNRCTHDTGEVLVELGFTLLSREHKAEPLGLLPVMEPDDMTRASELLALLAGHENVVARSMAELSRPSR